MNDQPHLRRRGVRRAAVALAGVIAMSSCAAGSAGVPASGENAGTHPPSSRDRSPTSTWEAVLRRLDRRRATAFARGDPRLLRRVYVAESAMLRADTATLRAYRRRDLELDAVRLDLLRVRPERHTANRVRLRVTDVLRPVRVRRPGGAWRSLPADRPTERIISLRRTGDGWRIAGARRVAG